MSATQDQQSLRAAFGNFATGVTVITAEQNGNPVGMTVNSFSSVSLTPPLISWCVGDQATLFAFFQHTDFFAVNVLSQQQQPLSNLFASGEDDCFDTVTWRKGKHNLPLLDGCIANFQCQVEHRYAGGDHTILVGRVLAYACTTAEPLIFFGGKYRELAG